MSEMDPEFRRAVIEAAGIWDNLDGPGDPNTIDLYRHARRVEELLHLEVPGDPPHKEAGVALVELVEGHFMGPRLLRQETPETIAERAGVLTDAIARAALLPHHSPAQHYIVALYAWHGCINMAKLLRRAYVTPTGEVEYKMEQRTGGYRSLSGCWSAEVARGNPWVRYGASLARLFESTRKGESFKVAVVEHWVPRESPYWED